MTTIEIDLSRIMVAMTLFHFSMIMFLLALGLFMANRTKRIEGKLDAIIKYLNEKEGRK